MFNTLEYLRINSPEYEISSLTLMTTEKLIDKLYLVAKSYELWWYPPLINISDKRFVLEWFRDKRKLTIYVLEDKIDYIAVWGADINNEMEDGDINIENTLFDFWSWIGSDTN